MKLNMNKSTSSAAIPFVNPFLFSASSGSAGNELYIEKSAKKFFDTLNGYEKEMVAKGIEALRSVKGPMDGASHMMRPNFWKMKKDPGTAGNYLISYEVISRRVTITSVTHNEEVLFTQKSSRDERGALYSVKKIKDVKFDDNFIPSETNLTKMRNSWGKAKPVTRIDTTHAAVNGMLNDFGKAQWLMGVHTDFSYASDNIKEYTLFHNPTETIWPDLFECARDQLGLTTQNAKHLSAVLRQIQNRKKPVSWLVHSQGGIIFKQAIQHHIKNFGGSLDQNTVAFHSGGNNEKVADSLLKKVGIKKTAKDNNNPFDMVPNLAGMNNLNRASIKRSVNFAAKVAGTPGQQETESPHTLPFVSLEFYRRMLIHGGDYDRAKQVKSHMKETGVA